MCAITKYVLIILVLITLSSNIYATESIYFTSWNSSNSSSIGTFYLINSTPSTTWNITLEDDATLYNTYYLQDVNTTTIIESVEFIGAHPTFSINNLANSIIYKIYESPFIQLKHYTPNSNTTMFKGRTQKYIVEVNKNSSIHWYINNSSVQYHNTQNITYPQLLIDEFTTNNSLSAGTYNVTVVIIDDMYPTLFNTTHSWYTTVHDVNTSLYLLSLSAFFATAFAILRKRR